MNKSRTSELSAKEWIEAVTLNTEGGKGGGKPDQANGTAPISNQIVENIVQAATNFLQQKGINEFTVFK